MDLDIVLVMKGLYSHGCTFFFLEHDAQAHSGIIEKIIADFWCNKYFYYLKLILGNP